MRGWKTEYINGHEFEICSIIAEKWGGKAFMAENTVFLLLTALKRNFYRHLISDANMKSFGLKRASRIKTFVFKHVSVTAKWVKTARQHILNIYTSNDAYMMVFKFDFG